VAWAWADDDQVDGRDLAGDGGETSSQQNEVGTAHFLGQQERLEEALVGMVPEDVVQERIAAALVGMVPEDVVQERIDAALVGMVPAEVVQKQRGDLRAWCAGEVKKGVGDECYWMALISLTVPSKAMAQKGWDKLCDSQGERAVFDRLVKECGGGLPGDSGIIDPVHSDWACTTWCD
jgi:hypothetical protein